jgi:ketosteroid isomerase-like protein
MSQQNVEIVHRAYAAFNRRDVVALDELTDPGWVMDWSRSIGPQQGVYRGREGVTAWIAAIQEAFESFEVSPVECIGSGSRIVVPTHVKGKGRGSGAAADARGTTLWELRDGKVVKMTLYQSRQEALEAASM